MDNLFSVEGKNIIVTGAARGNGLAIAKGLHERGANVFVIDKDDIEYPFRFTMQVNLSDSCQITSFVKILENKELFPLHGLVNNAGITIPNRDWAKKYWDDTFNVNLRGLFDLTRQLQPLMSENASIINITSLGGVQGFPDNPAYCASKGGLIALTRAMAIDFSPIRVNSICPGYIKTEMTKYGYNDPERKAERDERMIMNRWGEPEDLVGVCIFLLSKASSYVTGINLPVDGGWLAKGL